MKKIGIVTLTKDLNYGNRLQNYAVERLVLKHGGIPRTLFNSTWSMYGKTSKFKSYIGIPLTILKNRELGLFRQITALFDRFNDRYIHLGEEYNIDSNMDQIVPNYDAFITGSDQVWNPHWDFIGEKEYLTFANGKRKIALSASFGVSEIPEEKKESITEWLNGLNAISVRENRAAEIVRDLTGREVQVLIDPTMCVEAKEWKKIARRPFLFNKKSYVLMYILGDIPETCLSAVSQYCRENGSELVVLKDNKIFDKYPIGPCEYLYLIAHAKYVITDSFHGSVFSLLFHRNLAVFRRASKKDTEDMMSRLETLLYRFALESCFMTTTEFPFMNISEEKWNEIDEILKISRFEVDTFLKNALEEVT